MRSHAIFNFGLLALFCVTTYSVAFVAGKVTKAQVRADLSQDPHVFETNSLPMDDQKVASVGNGEIATVVYTDTVYMNNLYNGMKGESHRARIPSRINVRMQPANGETIVSQKFILDTQTGTFIERFEINGAVVEQKTFAHRLFTPLLITQIVADFSNATTNSLTLSLIDNPGPVSEDIFFNGPLDFRPAFPGKEQNGTTKVAEDPEYQSTTSTVSVIYSEVPDSIQLTVAATSATFIMAIAPIYEEAVTAYAYAMNLTQNTNGHAELYRSHADAWQNIWRSGDIVMEGPNLQLAKVVRGSMYYLLSSLPNEPVDANRRRFGGLSPGSLANGAFLKDYQGHSFWDTESWMFPPILMLWPHIAKDLLLYRMSNIQAARDRAVATGYAGARYPWESAFTGTEVTPDCCPETRDNQQHITGDISFAARQYWAATYDTEWLYGESYNFPLEVNGCDFIREMAQFWANRVEFMSDAGAYEINGVMPPDEDHPYVNNSIYTNVMASYSILFAKHIECQCGSYMTGDVPESWLDIARNIKIPYDDNLNYHPEFDGYVPGETIKQADVVLLGFPIMYVTDPVVRRNDLEIYENVTRADGPAMTWSMHAIGFLDIGDEDKAAAMLNRSYQPYLIEPFKIWNEAQNHRGAFNFITGMGGFLQSIIFGYAGFRLTVDRLTMSPTMPPGITKYTIIGLDYQGCPFNFTINDSIVSISNPTGGACDSLLVSYPPLNEKLLIKNFNGNLKLPRTNVVIEPKNPLSCPLPDFKIARNSAITLHFTSISFLFILLPLVFTSLCVF